MNQKPMIVGKAEHLPVHIASHPRLGKKNGLAGIPSPALLKV